MYAVLRAQGIYVMLHATLVSSTKLTHECEPTTHLFYVTDGLLEPTDLFPAI